MPTKYKILLIVCCISISTIVVLLKSIGQDRGRSLVPSTFSAGPGGCKALYLVLDELGIPVGRFRKPFTGLLSTGGVLIAAEPWQVPPAKREISKLKEWVEAGNRLLIFEGGGGPKPKECTFFCPAGSTAKPQRTAGNLARNFGLRTKWFPKSSRSPMEISSKRLFGVNLLSISNATRWSKPPEEWTIQAADGAGAAIVSRKLGKGEVWAVSDATIISNQNISAEQNVRLVPAMVLHQARPEHLLFDEYHHGYRLSESFWTYASSTLFAWIMIQGFVGAALFFYSRRARYSGKFRSYGDAPGRSSLEYVNSMANIFESSRAGSSALEAILNRFLGRLSRKAGVPLKNLNGASISNVAVRAGIGPDCATVVNQCRRAVASRVESAETLKLARRLAQLSLNRAYKTAFSTK